jgi:hypothetical protein
MEAGKYHGKNDEPIETASKGVEAGQKTDSPSNSAKAS